MHDAVYALSFIVLSIREAGLFNSMRLVRRDAHVARSTCDNTRQVTIHDHGTEKSTSLTWLPLPRVQPKAGSL